MLLLYPLLRSIRFVSLQIYIPLCFYFICDVAGCLILSDTIYIPLCFYFIDKFANDAIQGVLDLHSTMLLLYRNQDGRNNRGYGRFTFHYASTLSSLITCICLIRSNLHSTMLLLYQNVGSRYKRQV